MYTVRAATVADASTIVRHRRCMFIDMGLGDEAELARMSVAFFDWVLPKIGAGEYLAWFAVAEDGSVAAGAGLWLMDWPPHMIGGGTRRGNILNVYTEPAHRRRGLARRLTETAVEWCRANGVDTVILHASDDGRALYEQLGFTPTNEMRLRLG